MERDYEQLQRKIEEGLDAVRELKRIEAEEKRRKRPKLRLIKGGLLGGAIWAGVEWFRDYKRIAVALTAVGVTAVGAVIAEQPHSPGADPPPAAIPTRVAPVIPRHTPRPLATPTPTIPPRTSPLRTLASRPIESAKPSPTLPPTVPRPRATEATPTILPSVLATPELTETTQAIKCTVDVLGVKLCLPLG